MRFTRPPAGWLPVAAIVLTHAATGSTQTLPEVVVTATRVERPLAESLVDISVIDSSEIARFGASSLPELLRARAGVEISQNGGAGAVAGLFVRGSKTSQTLILDGGYISS